MAEGVVLKLSTEAAIKAQQDLAVATTRAIGTLDHQSQAVKAVEVATRGVAATQQQATAAIVTTGRATEQAASRVVTLSKGTASAIPLVTKLAQAAGGGSGAARALGIFGDAARVLAGTLNPVGIAIGFAASSIIGLVSNLLTAESPLQRTARLAKEAQQSFDLVGDSAKKAADAIAAAAGARLSVTGTGSVENQLQAATAYLDKLKEASRLQDQAAGRGASALNLPEIEALANSLGKSEEVIRALGRLATATGKEYDKALAVVRAAGLDVQGDRQVENPLLFTNLLRSGQPTEPALSRQGVPTLGREQADQLLGTALGTATNNVRSLQAQKFDEQALRRLREINQAVARETDFAALGNKEREVSIKLRELEDSAGRKFVGTQKELADQAIAAARALDQESEGYKALADARQKAIAIERVQGNLAGQAAFLRANPAERERLIRDQRILAEQQAAGVLPGTPEGNDIRRRTEELLQLEQAEDSLQRLKDAGREAFDTIANSIAQAAIEGKNFRQVLGSVAGNLSSLLLNRAIGAAGNAIFGPSPGGGAMLGRVLPQRWMMGGGVLDRAQTIVAGGYAVNVAEGGGASPEAIMPLGRDQFGRLGVRGDGGGGGTVIVNLPNVRTGEQARQVRPTLAQTVESVQRRGRRTLRAGR